MSFSEIYRRYKRVRTPILAVVATLLLAWSAIFSFDVPWQDFLAYFLASLFGLLVVIVAAAIAVAIIKFLR